MVSSSLTSSFRTASSDSMEPFFITADLLRERSSLTDTTLRPFGRTRIGAVDFEEAWRRDRCREKRQVVCEQRHLTRHIDTLTSCIVMRRWFPLIRRAVDSTRLLSPLLPHLARGLHDESEVVGGLRDLSP